MFYSVEHKQRSQKNKTMIVIPPRSNESTRKLVLLNRKNSLTYATNALKSK